MGERLYALLLGRGDHAVVVEVPLERHAQKQQHDLCGERDEYDVDAEFVQRGEEKPAVDGCQAKARGA